MRAQRLIHLSFQIPAQAEQRGGKSAETRGFGRQNSLMEIQGVTQSHQRHFASVLGPSMRRRRKRFWLTRIVEPTGLISERATHSHSPRSVGVCVGVERDWERCRLQWLIRWTSLIYHI